MNRKTHWTVVSLSAIGSLLLLAGSAFAQDRPKAEVFGGFSYCNCGADPDVLPRQSGLGWATAIHANLTDYFGITVDLSGHYGSIEGLPPVGTVAQSPSFSSYWILFGPRVTVRGRRATGFAHALAGFVNSRVDSIKFSIPPFPVFDTGKLTSTDFAMGFGGGVDITANDRLAFRLVQVDYLPSREENFFEKKIWVHSLRINTGLVLRFD